MDPADRWRRIDSLFYAALDLPEHARPQFLQQACGPDLDLLNEIESLLNSSEHTLGFARQAVAQVAREETQEVQPAARRVGAYQILKVLGEGGMGVVYLATRADEAYQQQVAIKLMHPGFAPSQGVLLRFRAERQILADLSHPNIARLLDGGMAPGGVPYLVMEYVDGVPIDDYCREHKLPIDDRLKLFRTVCAAVEYAHKNLVVHRDIKPGNILVTAEGEPKLLDFGIAKLLDPEKGNPTLTRVSERLMTPEYASPEQIRGEPITTATDVYALGVLLYELLAGRRPFQVQARSPMEAAQIICEQDPEPPSRVLTGNPVVSTPVAARQVKGDLDNIVLMAMRKEPSLRYTSVAALSGDVQAYLTGHSVKARTATWRYRGGKFVRRHKVAVSIAALAGLALIGFSTGMGLLARRADQARRIADQQRLAARQEADFLNGIFDAAAPTTAKGSQITARELLDQSAKRIGSEMAATPDVQATLLSDLGSAYEQLGLNDQAQPVLERAYSVRRKTSGETIDFAKTAEELAQAYRMGGHYPRAEALFREALQAAQKAPGDNTVFIARLYTDLGFCLYSESEDSEADSFFRKALALDPGYDDSDGAITRSLLAQTLDRQGHLADAWQLGNQAAETVSRLEGPSFHLAITRHILSGILRDMGNLREAEKVERQNLELWRKVGGGHIDVEYSADNLGVILLDEGDWKQAQPLLWEALTARQKQFGAMHPLVGTSLLDCGRVLQAKGDYKGAEEYLRQAADTLRKTIGPQSWRLKDVLDNFALLELDRGIHSQAESYARQALEMSRTLGGDEHPEFARSLVDVALAREFQNDANGAVPLLEQALAIRKKLFSPSHPDVIAAEVRLGEALTQDGNAGEAEPLLREALSSAEREPFPLVPWQIAEIQAVQGACLRELGSSTEAEILLRQSRASLLHYPEAAIRNRELRPIEEMHASDHSP